MGLRREQKFQLFSPTVQHSPIVDAVFADQHNMPYLICALIFISCYQNPNFDLAEHDLEFKKRLERVDTCKFRCLIKK